MTSLPNSDQANSGPGPGPGTGTGPGPETGPGTGQRHGLVFGLAALSGTGKTTLAEQLIRIFVERGYRTSSIKHAHHEFDPDTPGKDSWRHRKAGTSEMIISSSRRRVKFTETPDQDEADLPTLLAELSPADIVLVEGFKSIDFPKVEIHRAAMGHGFLYPQLAGIRMIATDTPLGDCPLPQADLNSPEAVADLILEVFRP
ncbi:MAG: molybdopterin-guanine dinucleotide biosynthesis protein B [Alphaproteobacteria bacterium]|nr:molybdopterin-guanine dinucleotide biosynthesis protein B [Alphaproteobacteria bacterium]